MCNVIVMRDTAGQEKCMTDMQYLLSHIEDLIQSKVETLTAWVLNGTMSYNTGEVDVAAYRTKYRELLSLEEDMWEKQAGMTDDEIGKHLNNFDTKYDVLLRNLKQEIQKVL